MEDKVIKTLSRSGWGDRAETIVIDPELENWVFSDSREVDAAIGWTGEILSLRSWLEVKGLLVAGSIKPSRPKEAMDAVLRHMRTPRSSSIYARLAERVGLSRCTDQAFLKLKMILKSWFPALESKQT